MFVVFALLQLNDPDPLVWTPIYALPALLCALGQRGQAPRFVTLPLSLLYLGAAIWWWPSRYAGITLSMDGNPQVEEAREAIGLLMGSCVMMFLYAAGRIRPSAAGTG
jgi:hypothetical protein